MIKNDVDLGNKVGAKISQPHSSITPFLPSPDISFTNRKPEATIKEKNGKLSKRFSEEAAIYSTGVNLYHNPSIVSNLMCEVSLLNRAQQIKYTARVTEKTSKQVSWKSCQAATASKLISALDPFIDHYTDFKAEMGTFKFSSKQKNLMRISCEIDQELDKILNCLVAETTPKLCKMYESNESAPCFLSGEVLYVNDFGDNQEFHQRSMLKRCSFALNANAEPRDFVFQETFTWLNSRTEAVCSFKSVNLDQIPPGVGSSKAIRSFMLPISGFYLTRNAWISKQSKTKLTLILQLDLPNLSFREKMIRNEGLTAQFAAILLGALMLNLFGVQKKETIEAKPSKRGFSFSNLFLKNKRRKREVEKERASVVEIIKLEEVDERKEEDPGFNVELFQPLSPLQLEVPLVLDFASLSFTENIEEIQIHEPNFDEEVKLSSKESVTDLVSSAFEEADVDLAERMMHQMTF